jgi:hypothetical protein
LLFGAAGQQNGEDDENRDCAYVNENLCKRDEARIHVQKKPSHGEER